MFHFNSHTLYLAAFVPAYASLAWYLTSDLASMAVLSALQASVTPVLITSRVSVTTWGEGGGAACSPAMLWQVYCNYGIINPFVCQGLDFRIIIYSQTAQYY